MTFRVSLETFWRPHKTTGPRECQPSQLLEKNRCVESAIPCPFVSPTSRGNQSCRGPPVSFVGSSSTWTRRMSPTSWQRWCYAAEVRDTELDWSHPPESNRRPTDYESRKRWDNNQEDPSNSNDFSNLLRDRWVCLGFLGRSSRTKHGH
jgi:hypothetical protein